MKYFWRILLITYLVSASPRTVSSEEVVWDRRPQPWQRQAQPVLSARTTKQSWCQIVCYSPHVLHHDGKFRMWYLGTSTASRANDIAMGYAESSDGLRWTEHPQNPILTGADVAWGRVIQTPFILWDAEDNLFKLWFVSGDGVIRNDQGKITENAQKLGYATSKDGIDWDVYPRAVFESGRSPSVIKRPEGYRMWMGSRPDLNDRASASLYQNIYEFTSDDGISWKRGREPVIRPSGDAQSTVYPFVIHERGVYYMWYGCHLDGRRFEIFCATSADGSRWDVDHARPAFPAAADRNRFDGRYTSTPCIVRLADRALLYYSARDWQTEYRDRQGRVRRDGSGVYADIGVAEIQLGKLR